MRSREGYLKKTYFEEPEESETKAEMGPWMCQLTQGANKGSDSGSGGQDPHRVVAPYSYV